MMGGVFTYCFIGLYYSRGVTTLGNYGSGQSVKCRLFFVPTCLRRRPTCYLLPRLLQAREGISKNILYTKIKKYVYTYHCVVYFKI